MASLLRAAFARATRSPLVARSVFGIKFAPLGEGDYFFDVTTIALFQFLKRRLSRDARLLDMGTGAAAVLGIALWRSVGCRVVSCDINPALVEAARRNVAFNGAPIEVRQSRFFDAVDDQLDTVSFNPPYVPSAVGDGRDDAGRRSQWDGGRDGTSVIADYLDAVVALGRPVTSYLGMNHQHVGRDAMARVLGGRAVDHRDTWRHAVLPVDVYTIASGKR
jgi:methylase of polypeptide subunit release factors